MWTWKLVVSVCYFHTWFRRPYWIISMWIPKFSGPYYGSQFSGLTFHTLVIQHNYGSNGPFIDDQHDDLSTQWWFSFRKALLVTGYFTTFQFADVYGCLVGGLEHGFYFFHILGIIIPTDFHIFQRFWNHQPDVYGCGWKSTVTPAFSVRLRRRHDLAQWPLRDHLWCSCALGCQRQGWGSRQGREPHVGWSYIEPP